MSCAHVLGVSARCQSFRYTSKLHSLLPPRALLTTCLIVVLMGSPGTPESILPSENAIDSGIDVDHTMEPPAESSDIEKSVSTRQVDSDISDSISIATVVGTIGDHTTDHMPSLPASVEPIAIAPKVINLDDLPLHSPSSQIMGTPFANDNTRFEYPFPDTNQTCDSSSSSATSSFSSPVTSTSPSSNSFPTSSTSSQISAQLSFPPSSHHQYNATHPKMKVQANPPIPPSLIKRRLRWSLSLLGRRRSSGGSQQSTGDESTMANITDGQQATSPPGSPIQERANH